MTGSLTIKDIDVTNEDLTDPSLLPNGKTQTLIKKRGTVIRINCNPYKQENNQKNKKEKH